MTILTYIRGWVQHRQDRAQQLRDLRFLTEMDDRMLADIGIDRSIAWQLWQEAHDAPFIHPPAEHSAVRLGTVARWT